MRKIVTGAFITLDGVMQAPGGPDEDRSGGFEYGGWLAPLWDEVTEAAIGQTFAAPFDLLLGRKTYDIFAGYWPKVQKDPGAKDFEAGKARIGEQFDAVTKYVATHRPEALPWKNSRALGADVVAALRAIKREDGPVLLTQGSSVLIRTLLANDLIDELRLFVFPVVLGRGKRLLTEGAQPAAWRLTRSTVSPKGVVIASYERAGDVKTGTA